jgi:hypothetical protein
VLLYYLLAAMIDQILLYCREKLAPSWCGLLRPCCITFPHDDPVTKFEFVTTTTRPQCQRA